MFKLRGVKSNRDAIGAAITIRTEIGLQTRMLQAGSGFLSQHSKEVFFGLGEGTKISQASIRWPNGLVQRLGELPLNHRIWIDEGSEPVRMEPFSSSRHYDDTTSRLERADAMPATLETWLLAPVSAPNFSLMDLSGKTHTLAALRGKPILLNFWVSESETCLKDLAAYGEHSPHWRELGLQIVTVNCDEFNAG